MFGDHYYHATLRKAVAVFGTIFNNINVVRTSNTKVLSQLKVPLAYGPKQKFLARLDAETGHDASMAIKLPRMSFEMTELMIDTQQQLQKRTHLSEVNASDSTKKKHIKHFTSYNIGMSLFILAKNQDDGLQILEQILPYFKPEYTVSIKPIDGWTTYKQDVPIVLTAVTIADEYESDYLTRRVLTYQLDFQMKMKFYGPDSNTGIIKEINLDFNNDKGGSEILENLDITINPTSADADDDYAVVTTIS